MGKLSKPTPADEAFVAAVMARDYGAMSAALRRRADVNGTLLRSGNAGRLTAVHVAVIENDKKLLSFLLDNGAAVNKKAAVKYGLTALGYAVRHEVLDLIPLLLQQGADSQLPEPVLAPMWLAATRNKLNIVQFLFDRGVAVDERMLLHVASNGHIEMTQLLVELGADTAVFRQPHSGEGWSPRMQNVYVKNEIMLDWLRQFPPACLEDAVIKDGVHLLQYVVLTPLDFDYDDPATLRQYVLDEEDLAEPLVQFLIDAGASLV